MVIGQEVHRLFACRHAYKGLRAASPDRILLLYFTRIVDHPLLALECRQSGKSLRTDINQKLFPLKLRLKKIIPAVGDPALRDGLLVVSDDVNSGRDAHYVSTLGVDHLRR